MGDVHYRFYLDGVLANPIFPDSLSKEFERETGQVFFREKINGKLRFMVNDYIYILSKPVDHKFTVKIDVHYGYGWEDYWEGFFYLTDCEIDYERECIQVEPDVLDAYTEILENYDKEFDLIKLAPKQTKIRAKIRGVIQVYIAGNSTIMNVVGSTYWEEQCSVEFSDSVLRNDYKFVGHKSGLPIMPYNSECKGQYIVTGYDVDDDYVIEWTNLNGKYKISRVQIDANREWFIVTRVADSVLLFNSYVYNPNDGRGDPIGFDFYPFGGEIPVFRCRGFRAYTRILTNANSSLEQDYLHDIPEIDIVGRNNNYNKIYNYIPAIYGGFYLRAYCAQKLFLGSAEYSTTETKYGLVSNCVSEYDDVFPWYKVPDNVYFSDDIIKLDGWKPVMPVCISQWFCYSLFMRTPIYSNEEIFIDKDVTVRTAYKIDSVISKLLEIIGSPVQHEATGEYSNLLYGANPLSDERFYLSITPKSNVVNSNYVQSASKAPIKLSDVFKFLEVAYGCKWYINNNKLIIENWKYFNYGGSYSDSERIGTDLTTQMYKGDVSWDYGKNIVNFNKSEMASRYQFSWMDKQSVPFDGLPIEIISGFVNKSNVKELSASLFSVDFDMIIASPSEISMDGFVVFASKFEFGKYSLPIEDITLEGYTYRCQNAWLAFVHLQPRYHVYNLPAENIILNDEEMTVTVLERFKTQKVSFPVVEDINPIRLIKTSIGKGIVEKISINLLKRFATGTIKHKI